MAACGVAFFSMAVAAPALAHHAFSAEFDAKKPVKLQGTVSKVQWINPYAWIHVDVKRPDGKLETWMIEGGTPNTLFRRGFTKDSLKTGTQDRRRRLSRQGRIDARQRARHHLYRRPQAVHGLVRHRRPQK
jgi:hypothetical protein